MHSGTDSLGAAYSNAPWTAPDDTQMTMEITIEMGRMKCT
jgi:hypothetical protein